MAEDAFHIASNLPDRVVNNRGDHVAHGVFADDDNQTVNSLGIVDYVAGGANNFHSTIDHYNSLIHHNTYNDHHVRCDENILNNGHDLKLHYRLELFLVVLVD